jgi:general secretion pathway protein G
MSATRYLRVNANAVDKPAAFTLIELLVVIAIIGVLATISVVALNFARQESRKAKAKHDIDTILTALKVLENDTGQWPGHQVVDEPTTSGTNEIWDLTADSAGIVATDGNFPNWNGPYMGVMPKDPWGNDYFYDSDYQINGENKVIIGSFGPNGVGPNLYDSDDIIRVFR